MTLWILHDGAHAWYYAKTRASAFSFAFGLGGPKESDWQRVPRGNVWIAGLWSIQPALSAD